MVIGHLQLWPGKLVREYAGLVTRWRIISDVLSIKETTFMYILEKYDLFYW